jgi:kynurenine formamidase
MLIELSYVLSNVMPKWPTNPSETPDQVLSFDAGDLCNASSIYHHMHNGTHVDAPRHFSEHGKSIVELPIDLFYYQSPLFLTIEKGKGEYIEVADLASFEPRLQDADILCIYTGYSKLREKDPEGFVDNFPAFNEESALYLRTNFPQLKAIALDVISVDSAVTGPPNGFPAHKALLDTTDEIRDRTLLLYEDVNLAKLLGYEDAIQEICAFPIRWEGAEAAPVNMVAVVP